MRSGSGWRPAGHYGLGTNPKSFPIGEGVEAVSFRELGRVLALLRR